MGIYWFKNVQQCLHEENEYPQPINEIFGQKWSELLKRLPDCGSKVRAGLRIGKENKSLRKNDILGGMGGSRRSYERVAGADRTVGLVNGRYPYVWIAMRGRRAPASGNCWMSWLGIKFSPSTFLCLFWLKIVEPSFTLTCHDIYTY